VFQDGPGRRTTYSSPRTFQRLRRRPRGARSAPAGTSPPRGGGFTGDGGSRSPLTAPPARPTPNAPRLATPDPTRNKARTEPFTTIGRHPSASEPRRSGREGGPARRPPPDRPAHRRPASRPTVLMWEAITRLAREPVQSVATSYWGGPTGPDRGHARPRHSERSAPTHALACGRRGSKRRAAPRTEPTPGSGPLGSSRSSFGTSPRLPQRGFTHFELSLQSSLQLSLAVLVRYRSRGRI
jgi:hypothetical protein